MYPSWSFSVCTVLHSDHAAIVLCIMQSNHHVHCMQLICSKASAQHVTNYSSGASATLCNICIVCPVTARADDDTHTCCRACTFHGGNTHNIPSAGSHQCAMTSQHLTSYIQGPIPYAICTQPLMPPLHTPLVMATPATWPPGPPDMKAGLQLSMQTLRTICLPSLQHLRELGCTRTSTYRCPS
jgi:hypothetical protein